MRIVLIFGALLSLAACAHEKRPAPLEAHPAGKVSEEALPPPAELSTPAASASTGAQCEPKTESC